MWKMCCCGLLFVSLGCSRSAVVVVPDNPSSADESTASERRVARGQDGETDGVAFAFPEDEGGVLLAKVLPPTETEAAETDRAKPVRRSSVSANWKLPALPLPPTLTALPRLPAPSKPSHLRPRLAIEETLGELPDAVILPQIQALPNGERVSVASVDANEPLALPILALPVTDRASLDDPTMEASIVAAVAATIPSRTAKAPFLKLTLPDPYDHRRSETTPTLPESDQPLTATLRTPGNPRTTPPR